MHWCGDIFRPSLEPAHLSSKQICAFSSQRSAIVSSSCSSAIAISTDMLCGTLQPDSIKFLSTARVTSLPSGPNVRLTSPSQQPCSCSPLRSSRAGAITGSDAPSSSRAWISEAAGRGESCFHSPFVLSTRARARASNSSIFCNTAW